LPVDNNSGNKDNVDPKVVQPQSPHEELPQDIVNNTTNPTRDQSTNNNAIAQDQSSKKIDKRQELKKVREVKNGQENIVQQKELIQQNDPIALVGDEIKRPTDFYGDNAAPLTEGKETRINPAVTFAKHTALDQETMPVVDDVVIGQQGGKRNGLRGLLRKVTRTFEKNTNISATDDDDRLLVGGLAIKLK
jgi:hypothetical protein